MLKEAGPGSFQEEDTVSATFVSACPRNHLRTEDTFLVVERFTADASWEVVSFIAAAHMRETWQRGELASQTFVSACPRDHLRM